MLYVYKVVCVPTGKVYVGYTNDARRRYRQHKAKAPKRMVGDVLKYVPYEDNFVMDILSVCKSEVEAEVDEERFIKDLRARKGRFGYSKKQLEVSR